MARLATPAWMALTATILFAGSFLEQLLGILPPSSWLMRPASFIQATSRTSKQKACQANFAVRRYDLELLATVSGKQAIRHLLVGEGRYPLFTWQVVR